MSFEVFPEMKVISFTYERRFTRQSLRANYFFDAEGTGPILQTQPLNTEVAEEKRL